MNEKKAIIAICLAAVLAFSPAVSLAQGTTTFSGEAVALKASAAGISLALSDTGALPSRRREPEHVGSECERRGYSLG